MNNIISKARTVFAMALVMTTMSCTDFLGYDKYLNKTPDDRAEINTVDKVQKLLTSAYPTHSTAFLNEYSSDNVEDNGKSHKSQYNQDEIYRYEQVIETGNDDPKQVWQSHYEAIAVANAALDAIATLGETKQTIPLKAEALLCRAYSIFSLANCFCMSYDDSTATSRLGIPYPKVSGVSVDTRGTLAETYANIDADIEAALPLINDSYLTKDPAYHFNRRAAYAFAARFNLYYRKYAKAKKYATEALGNTPMNFMRSSISNYKNLGGYTPIMNAYVNSSEPANFLIIPRYSTLGRAPYSSYYVRYNHNQNKCQNETYWAKMPWSAAASSANNCLYEAKLLYGNSYGVYAPFTGEFFEITDKVNQTGYAHIVEVPFTGDETALVRAEANILLNNLDEALVDINNWILIHCAASDGTMKRPTVSVESLKTFWDQTKTFAWDETGKITVRTAKKEIKSSIILTEDQKALLLTVLHMRRVETMFKGLRFQDLKRWGIEFVHPLDGEAPIEFKANDLRGAIQLPVDVIEAGLEKNPR